MYQQENQALAAVPSTGAAAQDFYLPLGGGIDPDLYVPEDRLHATGRISRWIQSLRTPAGKVRKSGSQS
ncbi:hypothetical protein [Pseudarthrobacter sp. C4D7]|uniref:hypothetical protein n=1 Tax=Pseudarthrobacter sp. C4D7 TaxID=2735268 RepID=UPI001585B93E|nr:hypothetical protein [Pseudarthrobacter sp. C4D7]NUT71656.1 hypothetical protein [Pseudarthrobacter sp. C4D7]